MGKAIIPLERVAQSIRWIRGQKVLLDSDLATLYGVPTKVLNQAVRRNSARFPEDFMFQLAAEETRSLRSQFVTLKSPIVLWKVENKNQEESDQDCAS